MAQAKDPRATKRDSDTPKSKKTERKAEAEKPAPKPVFTDWAAI